MCVIWDLVGRTPSSLSLELGSPHGTHGSSARPRGRRQETKVTGGVLAYHHCKDLLQGLGRPGSAATHMEGRTLPPSAGSTRARVC